MVFQDTPVTGLVAVLSAVSAVFLRNQLLGRYATSASALADLAQPTSSPTVGLVLRCWCLLFGEGMGGRGAGLVSGLLMNALMTLPLAPLSYSVSNIACITLLLSFARTLERRWGSAPFLAYLLCTSLTTPLVVRLLVTAESLGPHWTGAGTRSGLSELQSRVLCATREMRRGWSGVGGLVVPLDVLRVASCCGPLVPLTALGVRYLREVPWLRRRPVARSPPEADAAAAPPPLSIFSQPVLLGLCMVCLIAWPSDELRGPLSAATTRVGVGMMNRLVLSAFGALLAHAIPPTTLHRPRAGGPDSSAPGGGTPVSGGAGVRHILFQALTRYICRPIVQLLRTALYPVLGDATAVHHVLPKQARRETQILEQRRSDSTSRVRRRVPRRGPAAVPQGQYRVTSLVAGASEENLYALAMHGAPAGAGGEASPMARQPQRPQPDAAGSAVSEEAVRQIEEIGVMSTRDEIIDVLRAVNGNVEEAVHILLDR